MNILSWDSYIATVWHGQTVIHNASHLFAWKQIQRAQQRYLIEQILSYKTLFFNIVNAISYIFSLVTGICMPYLWKSTVAQMIHCLCCYYWNTPPTTSLCWHPPFCIHKHSASVDISQWGQFFQHGGILWHTFASYALLWQTPFCQTAALLTSVSQQQTATEYWREGSTLSWFYDLRSVFHIVTMCSALEVTEVILRVPPPHHGASPTHWAEQWQASTAIPPTPASNIISQYNNIGGVTSGASLVLL